MNETNEALNQFQNVSYSISDIQILSNTVEDPRNVATSHIMYAIGDVLKQYYFPILIPIGIVGNILSFLVMIQPNNRHMSFSCYICSLAAADTVVLLSALMSYLGEVHGVVQPRHQHWYCACQVFFTYSACLCSNYLLIAMTFERFYSITRPLKAVSFNTVKRARIIIACIFVFGFSYCVPFWTIAGNAGRTCVSNLFASDSQIAALYSWLIEGSIFLFPFIALLTMNSVIVHTLRKRSKLHLSESTGQGQVEGQNIKFKQSENQICAMLLLVTFAFLLLTIPARALVLYRKFSSNHTSYYFAGLHLFHQVATKSSATNHGINFFLYALSGKMFRADLRNLLFSKQLSNNTIVISNNSTFNSSLSSSISVSK